MSWLSRREIPIVLTAVVSFFLLINYFLIIPALSNTIGTVTKIGSVISAVAVGVGAISLAMLHGQHIRKRTLGQWQYSVWTIATMIGMVIAGLLPPMANHPAWNVLYVNVLQPIATTVYSLVGFYVCSAAYRSFRTRNLESTLILIPALLVMIGYTPIIEYYWTGWGAIRDWIVNVPNTAAWRGFLIGTAVGTIMLGVRTLMGLERGYLGEK